MKNSALYLIGKDKFEIRENPLAPLKSGEVLLRIKACGVCGTDLSYIGYDHRPEDAKILGHEFVGIIEEVGEGVTSLALGDRVIGEASIFCGECDYCKAGNTHFCSNVKFLGYPPFAGGFQEYVIIPADFCFKIPDNMSFPAAVLVEPVAVCLHALNLAKFKLEMNVAVLGCGPLGLMMIKLLKLAGANSIFASDPVSERRNAATVFGADVVIDPHQVDFVEIIKHYTKDDGVHRVFEVSGKPAAIKSTTTLAKSGGELIMVGVDLSDTGSISFLEANAKGLSIKAVRRLKNTLHQAMNLVMKYPQLQDIITHKFTLEQAAQTIVDNRHYQNGVIKSMLIF